MSTTAEVIILCITAFVFVVFAIVILALITHLIYKTIKKWKKKKNKDSNKVIYFLIITIIGIISFELSLIIIIIVIVQIFLSDDIIGIYPSGNPSEHVFFSSTYPILEYLIASFDSLGHLAMLYVFISRFQYTFSASIFNQSKALIIFMYIMLFLLAIVSVVILVFILPSTLNHSQLLIWEITWEFCIESMVLLILFLFVSNLYKLLRLSFVSHMKNGNKNDLISEITKASLERSKSSGQKSSKSKSSRNKKSKNHSKWTMTIDGTNVDPITPVHSINKSVKSTLCKSDEELNSDGNVSANNLTDNEIPDDKPKFKQQKSSNTSSNTSQAVEVLTVMNKMTLLVVIAAVGSFVTICGNFIIEFYGEFNEKDIADNSGLNHDAIWVFILPVLDMFITSLTLYLQFNFTHSVYRNICKCMDGIFLRCMLAIITYHWTRQMDTDEKHASFIVESNKDINSIVELQTKSTVTSAETKSTVTDNQIEVESNNIQIEIQNVTK